MITIKISILLILFIFAIATQAWSDRDNSMKHAPNRLTTIKIDENESALQKKKNPTLNPVRPIKKGSTPSPSTPSRYDRRGVTGNIKKNVDFLKAVEEKKNARRFDLDPILCSPEFLRSTTRNDLSSSRGSSMKKSSKKDLSDPASTPFPSGSKYPEGGTRLEVLRHLESKKEEILREIFMGLRFSFIPTSRQVVLEMSVTPSSEKGPGLIIPF